MTHNLKTRQTTIIKTAHEINMWYDLHTLFDLVVLNSHSKLSVGRFLD